MAEGRFESFQLPDGGSYQVYRTGRDDAEAPALLIFTPVFGVDDDMIRVADQWAAEGFRVAVPDYFFRVHPGPLERSEAGRAESMVRWKKLDVSQAIDDVRPLSARLRGQSPGNPRLGAIGFCAGGELAFLAGTRLGADAVASFHATRIHAHLDELSGSKAVYSLHYGDSDPLVPMSEVQAVQAAADKRSGTSVHVYPGAQHGFSFAGRPSYHELAATQSRKHASGLMATLQTGSRRTGASS